MTGCTTHAVFLLSTFLWAWPAAAQGDQATVRLAHNTRRDLLVDYALELEWSSKTGPEAPQILGRQCSTWTGYVVGSGQGGGVECVQMLVVEPPAALADGGPARSPARAGVQLSVNPWSRHSVGWLLPEANEPLGKALCSLCAWTDWPSGPIGIGRVWETPAAGSSAQWKLTLTEADPLANPPVVMVSFETVAGDPTDPQTEGRIIWDSDADLLLRAEGTAEWPADGGAQLLRMSVTRVSWEVTAAQRRTALRGGFTEAVRLAATYRDGRFEQAHELARRFLHDRPQSPWRPLAESIVGPTGALVESGRAEEPAELLRMLSKLVVAWQESAATHPGVCPSELPALVQLADQFRALVVAQRATLTDMTRAEDVDQRAMAAFALGFADDAASLARLYQMAEQAHPRVRAWAVYALAVRADPRSDARLLVGLLTDENSVVRARACQAAAACLGDNPEFRDRVKRLLFTNLDDDSRQVRFQAAAALEHFVERSDLARVKQAVQYEDVPLIRGRLQQIVARLEAVPG